MPVRRMVDDPIDRQRHILHQTVHAARISHILDIIDSILSILLLQRRSALRRLSRSSSVAVPTRRRQPGLSSASHAHTYTHHSSFSTLRSEEPTSELQTLIHHSYDVF